METHRGQYDNLVFFALVLQYQTRKITLPVRSVNLTHNSFTNSEMQHNMTREYRVLANIEPSTRLGEYRGEIALRQEYSMVSIHAPQQELKQSLKNRQTTNKHLIVHSAHRKNICKILDFALCVTKKNVFEKIHFLRRTWINIQCVFLHCSNTDFQNCPPQSFSRR